jgi:hypothetical protein
VPRVAYSSDPLFYLVVPGNILNFVITKLIIMKSIWLERGGHVEKHWIQMFEDCGVPNNHEFFTHLSNITPEQWVQMFTEADQICFISSLTTPGVELVENALNLFKKLGLKGKRILSGLELLDALNGFRIEWEGYEQIFADNEILELHEACFYRIEFNGKRWQYSEKPVLQHSAFND